MGSLESTGLKTRIPGALAKTFGGRTEGCGVRACCKSPGHTYVSSQPQEAAAGRSESMDSIGRWGERE